eukprot:scpid46540/ scgid7447/ Protein DD3-3
MYMLAARFLVVLLLVRSCWSDCYMHNPRGSNNRLNERSANRKNGNRVFDSQNNNRGGYNVGDPGTTPFQTEIGQYNMKYFQSGTLGSSELEVEWTNQHGCGGNEDSDPHKLNCNMVLQYMCQDHDDSIDNTNDFPLPYLRNGDNTNTQQYNARATGTKNETQSQMNNRMTNAVEQDRVIHESWMNYDRCYQRERNRNLFTADQQLRNGRFGYSSAIYTRQNPQGNRRGYECPEERDYYPYWHPTPWIDIAVLTDNVSHCETYYKAHSQNAELKYQCYDNYNQQDMKHYSRWNNRADCLKNSGNWLYNRTVLETLSASTLTACRTQNTTGNVFWGKVFEADPDVCYVLPAPVDCQAADWSRVNHLGNGRDGQPLSYKWQLPRFPSGKEKRCVLRVRYNISTDDYDPWTTTSKHNRNAALGRRSPVEQNPNINIGSNTNQALRLAINTAQFGRTFQDRSHVIRLVPRTGLGQPTADAINIKNLNVRGKRGNIVQTFPSVEYDFVPTRMVINATDYVHIQWTGSNTHNNGNPAGDGQAGDAGEGTKGTDRHNMVEISSADVNYPLPMESYGMFKNATIYWRSFGTDKAAFTNQDLAVAMASAGFFHCFDGCSRNAKSAADPLNNLLNNAPASFTGALLSFQGSSERDTIYHYICSRNNNFTNRSQKGKIIVKQQQQS